MQKAGQTQITLARASINGFVFAASRGRVFFTRSGLAKRMARILPECVWRGFKHHETVVRRIKIEKKNERKDVKASWQPPSQQVLRCQEEFRSQANFSVADIVPSHSVHPPPRPPCWTPGEPACICGSWEHRAVWLDEAGAPYLGDYWSKVWAAISAPHVWE